MTSKAKMEVKEKRRKAILKKVSSFGSISRGPGRVLNVRTTAASRPTIWSTTSSGVFTVGIIQEKRVS